MITGKPIEEIFKLLPDKLTGTSIQQLRKALNLLGYKTDSQLRRIYPNHLDPFPDLAILRIIWPKSGRKLGHWCVWDGGACTMLDPNPEMLYGNYKISSFLEVIPRAEVQNPEISCT